MRQCAVARMRQEVFMEEKTILVERELRLTEKK